MDSFAAIVNGYKLLRIVTKSSILDVCRSSGYASGRKTDVINVIT